MKIYVKASSNISKLQGNKFWDNSDNKHEDLRQPFIKELRTYWENCPYRLKKAGKQDTIRYNGLFGTGSGVIINSAAFPLKKGYYISNLIDDFCKDNNIPVSHYCRGNNYYIFANPYSRAMEEESSSSYGYNLDRINRAQQDVYGKTSKRKYHITIHIGNFRKDKSGKYIEEAKPFVKNITLESAKAQVSDLFYDIEVKDQLDDNWNEGEVEVYLKSEEPIADYKQSLKDYFLSIFNTIPEDFIRVSIFESLEY